MIHRKILSYGAQKQYISKALLVEIITAFKLNVNQELLDSIKE